MNDKIVLFPCGPCAPFEYTLSYSWKMTCSCVEFNSDQKDESNYEGEVISEGSSWFIDSWRGACHNVNRVPPCQDFGATSSYECAGIFNRLITDLKLSIDASKVAPGAHKLMLKKHLFNSIYSIGEDCSQNYDNSYISTTIDIVQIYATGNPDVNAEGSAQAAASNVHTLEWDVPMGKSMGVIIDYCGCGCDETIPSQTIKDESFS